MNRLQKIGAIISTSIMFALPAVVHAGVVDTNAGSFTLTADVESDYGVFCNGNTTSQTCSTSIAFGNGSTLDPSVLTQQASVTYLWATIATNLNAGSMYYRITDTTGTSTPAGTSCGDGSSNNCFQMTTGGGSPTFLPFQVAYTGCSHASSNTYTPGASTYPQLTFSDSGMSAGGQCTAMNQTNSGPQTNPGPANVGYFTFTIPEQTATPSAGNYSDNLTLTLCSTNACT